MSAPSGCGAADGSSTGSFAVWIEWMPTVPSKNAAANKSGFRGHQSTWKAQLSAEGS